MKFDHVSLGCRDLAASIAFYDAVLAPLGYTRGITMERAAAWGTPRGTDGERLWLVAPAPGEAPLAARGSHVALVAPGRAAVDAFWQAALAAGAKPNGAPGLRPEYSPDYYAAFVLDPDGHKIEAMCRSAA